MTGAAPAKPVIVLGAGGHAKVLVDLLNLMEREVLGLLDTEETEHDGRVLGHRVLGGDEILADFHTGEVVLVNAIGTVRANANRRERFLAVRAKGYRFETLVHPSAVVSPDARVGEGAQIMAGCVVQAGCRIGEDAIVNTRASVDHDCRVGAHAHVAPGVVLSGNVDIGQGAHIGTGSVVIQSIRIGDGCTIGAGSLVIRNVGPGRTAYGSPAVEVSS